MDEFDSYRLLTEEEMVAKFQRVTISSLHGYSLYLTRVPEDQLRNAEEKNKQIVSSSKFWDLAKHEVPLVSKLMSYDSVNITLYVSNVIIKSVS